MTTQMHKERLEAVMHAVRECQARMVLDLGCGDGDLLPRLADEPQIERVVGLDIDREALGRMRQRLGPDINAGGKKIELLHGSMSEGGDAFTGFDCAILLETIEHIDPDRLSALEMAVFGRMHPGTVIITTPNAEFNQILGVPQHRFRHPDHRFEWDRMKFRKWAQGVAARHGYQATCSDIAGHHPIYGGASQMAVFVSEKRPGDSSRADRHPPRI